MRQDIYDLTVAYILENQEKFYRLAYSYVQDRDSALDVVQNSICQALEKCWGLRNPAAMKTWFYRIVVNEALQYLRRHKKEISTEPSEMREEPYQEEGFLKADAGSRRSLRTDTEASAGNENGSRTSFLRGAEPSGNFRGNENESEHCKITVVCSS